jgi:hypothetical protein
MLNMQTDNTLHYALVFYILYIGHMKAKTLYSKSASELHCWHICYYFYQAFPTFNNILYLYVNTNIYTIYTFT